MNEREVRAGGRSIMVRDAGDPGGSPVVYFHGTPGCRLDVSFGEGIAGRLGVRVISFDRPGYGRSDPAPYSLSSVALDTRAIADSLGLGLFAVLGWSGGRAFALAAAAVMGERVTQAGVAGGDAPFQQMPGALDRLDENDRLALSFLPGEPARAAEQFLVAGEALIKGMMSARDDERAWQAFPFRDSEVAPGLPIWQLVSAYPLLERINAGGVAVYLVTGWYDIFARDVLLLYRNLSPSPSAFWCARPTTARWKQTPPASTTAPKPSAGSITGPRASTPGSWMSPPSATTC